MRKIPQNYIPEKATYCFYSQREHVLYISDIDKMAEVVVYCNQSEAKNISTNFKNGGSLYKEYPHYFAVPTHSYCRWKAATEKT